MNGGTIFVLFLAAGFVALVVYLARVSRRTASTQGVQDDPTKKVTRKESPEKPPLKRAG